MKWDDKIVDWVRVGVGVRERERERERAPRGQCCVLVHVIMNLGGFIEDWKFLE
jgi:hypothetical protein